MWKSYGRFHKLIYPPLNVTHEDMKMKSASATRLASLESKLKVVDEQQRPVFETNLEYYHKDCALTTLSKGFDAGFQIRFSNQPITDGHIAAFFSIPKALDKEAIYDAFRPVIKYIRKASAVLPDNPDESTLFEMEFIDRPIERFVHMRGINIDAYTVFPQKEQAQLDTIGVDPYSALRAVNRICKVINFQYKPKSWQAAIQPEHAELAQFLLDRGYFRLPTKGITLQQAARELHVSDSWLSLRVRDMEAEILKEYFRKTATTIR